MHASSTLLRLVVAPARARPGARFPVEIESPAQSSVQAKSLRSPQSSITVVRSILGSSQLTVTGYGPNTPAHMRIPSAPFPAPALPLTGDASAITRSRTRPCASRRRQHELGSSKGQGLAGGSYDPAWSRGLVLAAAGTLRACAAEFILKKLCGGSSVTCSRSSEKADKGYIRAKAWTDTCHVHPCTGPVCVPPPPVYLNRSNSLSTRSSAGGLSVCCVVWRRDRSRSRTLGGETATDG